MQMSHKLFIFLFFSKYFISVNQLQKHVVEGGGTLACIPGLLGTRSGAEPFKLTNPTPPDSLLPQNRISPSLAWLHANSK